MSYRIMCAYHASPLGDKAFEFALRLADRFEGELFVLSVFQPPEDARDTAPGVLLEAANQEFGPAFERLRLEAKTLRQPVRFDVSVGYSALHVLYEAQRRGIQHIVLAADKNRLGLVSPSQRIALLAECHVTLVR